MHALLTISSLRNPYPNPSESNSKTKPKIHETKIQHSRTFADSPGPRNQPVSEHASRSIHPATAFAMLAMIAGSAPARAADTYEWQGGNGNWASANWTLNGTTSNQPWNNGGYDNTATINSGSISLDTWAAGETLNMDGGCVVNRNGNGLTFSHIYVGSGNGRLIGTNNHGGGSPWKVAGSNSASAAMIKPAAVT